MRPNEQKPAPTQKELVAIGYGISFHSQQAWTFSVFHIASYLNDHTSQYVKNRDYAEERPNDASGDARASDTAALMAAGRLEWLLRKTRPSLSGLLCERDVIVLLDCYRGAMSFPDQFDSIASDLCDHFMASGDGRLTKKLCNLSSALRLTLADALVQTWHCGITQENMSPKEFLATLGIDLT